jgi:tetratricopeptide (TPR) repeat protein
MPTHFVGRSELVEKMVRQLRSKENLAVEGLPGVGKTTLAVALARHLGVRRSFKDGILWASLGPHADVTRALTRWAEALEKDITQLTSEAERSQTIRDAIGQKRMLIVIDDVWDLVPANVLRCGGPNCCHLLTTRDKAIARAFVDSSRAESLPTLDDDRAYQLLQALASEACAAYPNAVRSLVQAVGGLPLAIRLIGGYLAAPEHSMFGDFFPDLSEEALSEMANPQKRLQLAQERLGVISDEKTTLQDTITLSLEGLPDSAKMAFYALGAFAPKPERFSRKAAKAVTQAASAILALLAARNLLEVEEEGRQLTVHQTVADVARTQLDEAAIVRHRDYYLNQVNEDKENWQRIEAVYGQIEWAWHQAPADKNLLDFIWALRPYQNNRGLWRISLDWANRGLRVAHGKDKVELLIRIGSIYGSQEQHDKAKDYHQHAERFVEKVNDQAAKADFLHSKGVSYFSRGQYALALDHLERALQNTEASDQGKLGGTLNLLGLTYQKLNQWRTALDYYQLSVQALEKAEDRRDRAITLSNIGLLYQNLGQSERALEHYRQAVSIQEEIGDLTGECITRYNIATIYRENGRLAKSVAELSRVVEIDRLTEDPDLESDSALLAQVEEELATQE